MANNVITIKEYCTYYEVEPNFLEELSEMGLLTIVKEKEESYIPIEEIPQLESYSRMFYDLDINMAGIDAIHNLISRIKVLQKELTDLQNRINFYE
ncbi:chaperone modulator CbpM [Apibacter adventoris]|uniref:MerR family transcriptional regulator n=1 Tax=Apibacter adventoris TaxID=1679466 RepID=A0A2S8AFZ3_9FLAO|nr:chaperone modulator CbpM [Apibacter adventoris]PQL93877.1 MerR family transcriptional regulator [Apibacter adventoris]PQL95304.1 MerR family transcriptional regulator [Apibacter adventoris]